MGDNTGYISCLFCPVTGISEMKTRNISTLQYPKYLSFKIYHDQILFALLDIVTFHSNYITFFLWNQTDKQEIDRFGSLEKVEYPNLKSQIMLISNMKQASKARF